MPSAENPGSGLSQPVAPWRSDAVEAIPLAEKPGGLPVFDVRPAGRSAGAVVVLHEAFGVDGHIIDASRRLASMGYHCVAPHLFHRTGDPADLRYEDLPAVQPHVRALTIHGLAADLDAVLAYLAGHGHGPGDVAILGFSLGASATIALAARRSLGAAVSFCPGGLTAGRLFGLPPLVDLAREMRTPWLGLFAGEDPNVPATDVERLRAAASAAAAAADAVCYPGAMHSFYCRARGADYDESVAEDAWQRVSAHLRRYLPGATL